MLKPNGGGFVLPIKTFKRAINYKQCIANANTELFIHIRVVFLIFTKK